MTFPSAINGGTAPFDYFTKAEINGMLLNCATIADTASVQATSNVAQQEASAAQAAVLALQSTTGSASDLQALTVDVTQLTTSLGGKADQSSLASLVSIQALDTALTGYPTKAEVAADLVQVSLDTATRATTTQLSTAIQPLARTEDVHQDIAIATASLATKVELSQGLAAKADQAVVLQLSSELQLKITGTQLATTLVGYSRSADVLQDISAQVQNSMAGKASQAQLDLVAQGLNNLQSAIVLGNLASKRDLQTKADASDLAQTNAAVATNVSPYDLATAIATKANSTDLTQLASQLSTQLATKVTATDVAAILQQRLQCTPKRKMWPRTSSWLCWAKRGRPRWTSSSRLSSTSKATRSPRRI